MSWKYIMPFLLLESIDETFSIHLILGAEDIKTHMDEFKEELSLGQRLTDTDILELHILIEQASHEIRHLRPAV